MRIVTRPDFDGVICAVLLRNVFNVSGPIKWVEPSDIQNGITNINEGDIIANLPYHNQCLLWFDHHCSNQPNGFTNGSFKVAPSAAGVIYEYYRKYFNKNFDELIIQTDKIDSADLSLDEILNPEENPYLLLSMTISGRDLGDEPYWNYLVDAFGEKSIKSLMSESTIVFRSRKVIENNLLYEKSLISNTSCIGHVSISDFRSSLKLSNGNRFLVHALFPEVMVNIKVFFEDKMAIISASKSIIKSGCLVNLGKVFKTFGGGGHDGAGACSFPKKMTDKYLSKILDSLL